MTSFIIDKLKHTLLDDKEDLGNYLKELTNEDKINNIEFQEVTQSGIWRIYVDFKEVEDASEFLMRFWGMRYKQDNK